MQSEYFVRRQHDGVKMARIFMDIDRAILHASICVSRSQNTASYEVVRQKDGIIVAIVNEDHSVGYS